MRLPRRVPWASTAELDQVRAWIYADKADRSTQELAVHRLAAWRSITPLPHALESTLAFLTVILQDDETNGSSVSSYSLRQSYATALIRFVNGLVDPLQSGPYARSIASIAAQVGLPAWFVELRHAATHEDLPSLEVLREAARKSLGWLLHNYFSPVLNPTPADQSRVHPMRPVSPLLKQYKFLSKIIIRDVSLKSRYQAGVTKVLRDIERWVSEVRVAADVAGGAFGWDVEAVIEPDDNRHLDIKERIALEGLCDALLEKGYLVPLSKRKRALAKGSFIPPEVLISLWAPLLSHIQSLHSAFTSLLISDIVLRILSDSSARSQPHVPDHSYEMCLASWVMFLLRKSDKDDLDQDYDTPTTRNVIIFLLNNLGPVPDNIMADRRAAKTLLKELCKANPQWEETCSRITNRCHVQTEPWTDDYLSVMTGRLDEFLGQVDESPRQEPSSGVEPTAFTEMYPSDTNLPQGWRRVDASNGWKPSPIGVFIPCK